MINGQKYLPRVPSEYQEVEYLQSSGTQYIDTNIIPTNNSQTKVQFEFQLTDITNGQYQSIGCNSNINFTAPQLLYKFRSNAIEIADFDTDWHTCEISKSINGKLTIFDGEEYRTTATTEAALHFLLFGMTLDNGMYYGRYKLKYFKCYDNNIIVRNMIPVRRISDSVLGMYDTVNDVFYTNQGTDTFTAGADVSPWHDTPIPTRKLHNKTDIITSLPTDIYTDGNNATVGLVGNMSQTGTPTPQNPIQPSETGDLETTGEHAGQYKIPISSANTTTPVYLGEVQTTRKIGKLVLTGNETFYRDYERNDSWRFYSLPLVQAAMNTGICSHFEYIGTSGVNSSDNIGYSLFSASQFGCRFPKSIANTVNEFKAWLAQQYANGTPVTVWYVLATETTGIVNEPIRKIGNYADTVSGISIPTITGKDTFDVQTTLKPSEVSLTYTGWHDASTKEWDGSEWQ